MYGLIKQRWRSSEAFYAERDHRTRLEVANLYDYVDGPVEIYVNSDAAGDLTIQRIAVLAANLTARWARNIHLVVPNVRLKDEMRIHGDLGLQERIAREMRDADPFGNWKFGKSTLGNPSVPRLVIGSPCGLSLTPEDYLVDAS